VPIRNGSREEERVGLNPHIGTYSKQSKKKSYELWAILGPSSYIKKYFLFLLDSK